MRNFFGEQGFIDVLTPPAVENPGMEVHIHPFQLFSVQKQIPAPLYLHTSPEFCMKELLSEGFEKIFSISYCFRDEPESPIHRSQFLMLEWYRAHERYEAIMRDAEALLDYVIRRGTDRGLPLRPQFAAPVLVKKTMAELFRETLGVDVLNHLDVPSIKELLARYPDVPVPPSDLEWDDYFFLLYLNKVEPAIARYPLLLVTEFPAPLAALSTLKREDPRVSERFEIYVNGIELCNCFNELTDTAEQRRRFAAQNQLKRRLYGYELPAPSRFYGALDRGLPPSAGIALGVERLLHALFAVDDPFYY
jgi:lysyl-tRNA synthetase class 2